MPPNKKKAFVAPAAVPGGSARKRSATDPRRRNKTNSTRGGSGSATMRLGNNSHNGQPNGEELARIVEQKKMKVSFAEAEKILNNIYRAKIPEDIDSQVLLTTEVWLRVCIKELEQTKQVFIALKEQQEKHKEKISRKKAVKQTLIDLDKAISASDREAKDLNSRIKAIQRQHKTCKAILDKRRIDPVALDSDYVARLDGLAKARKNEYTKENTRRNREEYKKTIRDEPERLTSGKLTTDPMGPLPKASGDAIAGDLLMGIQNIHEQAAIRYVNPLDLSPRYIESKGYDESQISLILRYIRSNQIAQRAIPELKKILAEQKKNLAANEKTRDMLEKYCSPKLLEGSNLAENLGQLYLVKSLVKRLKMSIGNTERMLERAEAVIRSTQRHVDELKEHTAKGKQPRTNGAPRSGDKPSGGPSRNTQKPRRPM